jgi:hypothetical protein
VSGAKQPVDQIGIDVTARGPLVVEVEVILAHTLEDLLGLRHELLVRLAR